SRVPGGDAAHQPARDAARQGGCAGRQARRQHGNVQGTVRTFFSGVIRRFKSPPGLTRKTRPTQGRSSFLDPPPGKREGNVTKRTAILLILTAVLGWPIVGE